MPGPDRDMLALAYLWIAVSPWFPTEIGSGIVCAVGFYLLGKARSFVPCDTLT